MRQPFGFERPALPSMAPRRSRRTLAARPGWAHPVRGVTICLRKLDPRRARLEAIITFNHVTRRSGRIEGGARPHSWSTETYPLRREGCQATDASQPARRRYEDQPLVTGDSTPRPSAREPFESRHRTSTVSGLRPLLPPSVVLGEGGSEPHAHDQGFSPQRATVQRPS